MTRFALFIETNANGEQDFGEVRVNLDHVITFKESKTALKPGESVEMELTMSSSSHQTNRIYVKHTVDETIRRMGVAKEF